MNRAPKFSKVELIIKEPNLTDTKFNNERKIEFLDCGLMITGDYIIVIIDEKNELNDTLASTGRVFSLNQVAAYKTHSI